MADSDERAYEEGRNFYWQLGRTFGRAPREWTSPPGYASQAAAISPAGATEARLASISYEEAEAMDQIITGSPDTVIRKLKKVVDVADPAELILWAREGPMSQKAGMRSIELLAKRSDPRHQGVCAADELLIKVALRNSWAAVLGGNQEALVMHDKGFLLEGCSQMPRTCSVRPACGHDAEERLLGAGAAVSLSGSPARRSGDKGHLERRRSR